MAEKEDRDVSTIIRNRLSTYYNYNVFTAASVSFYAPNYQFNRESTINYGYCDDLSFLSVSEKSLFDLASLTKPLVTVLSLLYLIDAKKLRWDDTVAFFFDEFKKHPLGSVTVESLMKHRSGLPAHQRLDRELAMASNLEDKKKIVIDVLATCRFPQPGKPDIVYSDLGYLLLGFIVERISVMRIDQFWKSSIAEPLGVADHLLFPGSSDLTDRSFVATRTVDDRSMLYGIVHDDNCRALGGICGHAGLFGTSPGVFAVCKEILDCYKGKESLLPVSHKQLARALQKQKEGDWTAGFQTPSKENSSSGDLFSPDSVGHLGYTGTSFWIDPLREVIIVLLTNRVYKGDEKEGIRMMRPDVHNLVGGLITGG
ncbi:serine hydrolase domain-containing protein [Desulfofustis limnaeus]|jgi:CubicO group peptidase (beta-lactamase class C family)|uniref:Esterase n=1 Tax=Desulfofustis limnaeus TaxID=2740163 RepID=A0ABM7WDN4_9BACT|nr:serine hydrolase domain-containing protein [Desulfofustis limnaeus]MDX9896215.1 serine hydrolase domain-containing protein [Desulfofustis sp.]BDD89086.1 esterase [Desulfofustis limnaeus]